MFDGDIASAVQRAAPLIPPVLLGIILHEIAHGWVAARLGDPTARDAGRLTLNPLPHIDPLGLLVFAMSSLAGGFVFGWARPVPVDPRWFRNPSRGMMLVALAGPLTNILLAVVLAGLLGFMIHRHLPETAVNVFLVNMLFHGLVANVGLACLNLLPIPPLDGSRVVAHFLPGGAASAYMRMGRFGLVILMILLASGILDHVLLPSIRWSVEAMLGMVGLHL